MFVETFPDTWQASSSRFLKRGCFILSWFYKYHNWSPLDGMINAGLTNKAFSSVYQIWFGQPGTTKMSSALSAYIFCNTFTMHEDGRKW